MRTEGTMIGVLLSVTPPLDQLFPDLYGLYPLRTLLTIRRRAVLQIRGWKITEPEHDIDSITRLRHPKETGIPVQRLILVS